MEEDQSSVVRRGIRAEYPILDISHYNSECLCFTILHKELVRRVYITANYKIKYTCDCFDDRFEICVHIANILGRYCNLSEYEILDMTRAVWEMTWITSEGNLSSFCESKRKEIPDKAHEDLNCAICLETDAIVIKDDEEDAEDEEGGDKDEWWVCMQCKNRCHLTCISVAYRIADRCPFCKFSIREELLKTEQ